MLEVADIFRRHSAAYRATHRLLPSQLRALQDIEACRTAYFGGHLKQCDHCAQQVYAYHSCRNRHSHPTRAARVGTPPVPNVMATRRRVGSRNKSPTCCLVLTTCSLLPYRQSYGPWPTRTRK
jgi:hypothetical protein